MISRPTRRALLKGTAASALAPLPAFAQASGRVVVVGGGFAGAACARYLRRIAPGLAVTLIEPNAAIVTCPGSNHVLAGFGTMEEITYPLDPLRRDGLELVQDRVERIDPASRRVWTAGGAEIGYDRLVLAPGVDFKWGAVEGYDSAAAEIMPHAWKAGPQTVLLRRQLEAMRDGGVVVITAPANPYRCPPGPYERASLIANYLKTNKPRSKVIVLDGKDTFSKQALFLEGWKRLYPGLIEWLPFSQAGALRAVDPKTMTLTADFLELKADVANVIPPQRAGALVYAAGLTGKEDWCKVDATTLESDLMPGVHVLGDAIFAGAMPKSATSATSQAKVCALAIAALQSGQQPSAPSFLNVCYSLVAPEYGISVTDVFRRAANGTIAAVEGAGGTSPLAAPDSVRQAEAGYTRSWYRTLTAETFR